MKLKNRNPANFVGRIIIHRHQSWKIQSVIGDTIYLCRDYLDYKGQLKLHQFADCRLFPTHAEVQARYPKLIRALCWMFKLTQEEAVKAVRGHVTTGTYYMDSEAIALLGGSARALGIAWRGRHKVRRQVALAVQ
jgi:hypothetical protein